MPYIQYLFVFLQLQVQKLLLAFHKQHNVPDFYPKSNESFVDQQELLLYELQKYQKDEKSNDDVTVIGVKI